MSRKFFYFSEVRTIISIYACNHYFLSNIGMIIEQPPEVRNWWEFHFWQKITQDKYRGQPIIENSSLGTLVSILTIWVEFLGSNIWWVDLNMCPGSFFVLRSGDLRGQLWPLASMVSENEQVQNSSQTNLKNETPINFWYLEAVLWSIQHLMGGTFYSIIYDQPKLDV